MASTYPYVSIDDLYSVLDPGGNYASVVDGISDLALRQDQPEQAARLLGAAAALRGLPDSEHPDVARIEREARNRLGDKEFAEAVLEGTRTDLSELTQVTLAS